jgi:hypothetical protein
MILSERDKLDSKFHQRKFKIWEEKS